MVSFGLAPQTLLTERTAWTIGLGGNIYRTLGEGILLTHFTQPEGGSCWTAEHAVLL
jgi:hypothetical protein